jgi:3-oxoacyl-[acyl-carrier-protein] synthase III
VNAAIRGIAYHLPNRVETNEDLARENPDWPMGDLSAKLGITARHLAADGETASDLGYHAAHELLERNLVGRDEIDYLLFCTQSPDYFLPSGACILQDRLGLGKHIGAFDFNLGCSGFVYGLQVAQSFIVSGIARNVLLITADTYTRFIHPRDRTVRALFGDGAAATLIGGAAGVGRIGTFVLGTDGAGAKNLIVAAGGLRMPRSPETARLVTDAAGCTRSQDNIFMEGRAIFGFSLSTVPAAVESLLRKANLTPGQIDWYVYHQANQFMLQHLARQSRIPIEKMVMHMETVGNTVSASIPIALAMHAEAGSLCPGQRVVLAGFGVGYSWAVCDLVWE